MNNKRELKYQNQKQLTVITVSEMKRLYITQSANTEETYTQIINQKMGEKATENVDQRESKIR